MHVMCDMLVQIHVKHVHTCGSDYVHMWYVVCSDSHAELMHGTHVSCTMTLFMHVMCIDTHMWSP